MPAIRARKKPVEIEAFQLDGSLDVAKEAYQWVDRASPTLTVSLLHILSTNKYGLVIMTPEGDMRADPGDYVIRGIKGEHYPCKPDIFEATYEVLP